MNGYDEILEESTADDYAVALQLQEHLNSENSRPRLGLDEDDELKVDFFAANKPELRSFSNAPASNERHSTVIDNSWELIDPNPDARDLFVEFNQKYFWDKLTGVEIRWSTRMTL